MQRWKCSGTAYFVSSSEPSSPFPSRIIDQLEQHRRAAHSRSVHILLRRPMFHLSLRRPCRVRDSPLKCPRTPSRDRHRRNPCADHARPPVDATGIRAACAGRLTVRAMFIDGWPAPLATFSFLTTNLFDSCLAMSSARYRRPPTQRGALRCLRRGMPSSMRYQRPPPMHASSSRSTNHRKSSRRRAQLPY